MGAYLDRVALIHQLRGLACDFHVEVLVVRSGLPATGTGIDRRLDRGIGDLFVDDDGDLDAFSSPFRS